MLHLPILRHGVPYRSLDVVARAAPRTREPFVEISQANVGLIRRDLLPSAQEAVRARWRRCRSRDLLAMCAATPRIISDTTRCRSATTTQTPDDYVAAAVGDHRACRSCWCGATCSTIAAS